jgi:bifunctional UDP-N-acetylglucosamine pyrophosphorylase/glucosamine-1-phosphate N-acetyltransferase
MTMQAVILCAGKGVRMGELTRDKPKPLLTIGDRTLLERKLEKLPETVDEIILVIGYKGEAIREFFGNKYGGRKISYTLDSRLTGTATALWSAKEALKGKFIVMMGDDIYSEESLKKCSEHDFSIVCKRANEDEAGSRVVLENGKLKNFVTPKVYQRDYGSGGLIFTGLYSLTTDIFNYEPIKMELKEEWGLPQTLLSVATTTGKNIEIIETNFWLPVGNPEELAAAELALIN